MRIVVAIKAFFAALLNQQTCAQIEQLLAGQTATIDPPAKPSEPLRPAAVAAEPQRSAAVTLLATLQREARLVDLIQEDLNQFSDAQVGSAARPCLQQCAGVLDRLFGLKPLVAAAEGESIDVGQDASPLRYQWIGEGSHETGKLVHHGWEATKVDLPQWSGGAAEAKVIAPAQVQSP